MNRKFGFIFMSIIVLGLIFNTSAFSNKERKLKKIEKSKERKLKKIEKSKERKLKKIEKSKERKLKKIERTSKNSRKVFLLPLQVVHLLIKLLFAISHQETLKTPTLLL